MKKALIVGIDDYPNHPLNGCVNDAIGIANVLEKNEDGSPNFSIRILTSDKTNVSSELLSETIQTLFTGEADTAFFFFAGHGIINPETNNGYIVTQDGKRGSLGIPLFDILSLANKASHLIKSTVIVLDSCYSGSMGEVSAINNTNIATIGTGVTILTSCDRNGSASEVNGHGLFTSIIIDGLNGSCADICGRITPASMYSHVDQTLGPWEQRPIYKANVKTFVTLRQVKPKIPLAVLRQLPKYFPTADAIFPLDPSFEPDRENVPTEFKDLPINEDNTHIFKELQMCNRHGLITPIDVEHMYYAAINSTGCKLTVLGKHYRNLAQMKRI